MDARDCHFLGTSGGQSVFYIEDCHTLYSHCPADPHYLWADIQFSKGKVNNYEASVKVEDEELKVIYRSAPCNGVKVCPDEGCDYTVPVKDHRLCRKHPHAPLQKTNTVSPCPVQLGYVYPVDIQNDRRRWLFAFVHHHKGSNDNLHKHRTYSASHPLTKTLEDITNAAAKNSGLKPTEIAQGKGVGYVPGVVDKSCANLERVSRIVRQARETSKEFDVLSFESVADHIDSCEVQQSCVLSQSEVQRLRKISRPYLASAGIEDGIQYIHTMNPLMSKVLSHADFVEADITFNETREYKYVFNMVAFDQLTMEWMVVSRVRMTREDHSAYALGFRKTFDKCKREHKEFELGKTLLGVVIDWSDAEMRGLREAVGTEMATKLLKGCQVHWNRSWQRVRDRVASSRNKTFEKRIFEKIAQQITKVKSGKHVCDSFKVLCGEQKARTLVGVIDTLQLKEAIFVEQKCDWSVAKKWAQWWMRSNHLAMLHKDYSSMDDEVWDKCPSTSNAVERRNAECKASQPVALKLAMINIYNLDKSVCAKHMAAQAGVSISHRDRSETARRSALQHRESKGNEWLNLVLKTQTQ